MGREASATAGGRRPKAPQAAALEDVPRADSQEDLTVAFQNEGDGQRSLLAGCLSPSVDRCV